MDCEAVREQLPDHILGTLPETESAAIRLHLRGCSACRTETAALDRGLAMLSTATHEVRPPDELRERVLSVLSDEWDDSGDARGRRRRWLRWVAIAAAMSALVAALAWGAWGQLRADRLRTMLGRFEESAREYEAILGALGGKDIRVAVLQPEGTSVVEGSAILYDSKRDQSWVLVLARAPGYRHRVGVTVASPRGHAIRLPPIRFNDQGEGWTFLVTSAELSGFRIVRLNGPEGDTLASGTTGE